MRQLPAGIDAVCVVPTAQRFEHVFRVQLKRLIDLVKREGDGVEWCASLFLRASDSSAEVLQNGNMILTSEGQQNGFGVVVDIRHANHRLQ